MCNHCNDVVDAVNNNALPELYNYVHVLNIDMEMVVNRACFVLLNRAHTGTGHGLQLSCCRTIIMAVSSESLKIHVHKISEDIIIVQLKAKTVTLKYNCKR